TCGIFLCAAESCCITTGGVTPESRPRAASTITTASSTPSAARTTCRIPTASSWFLEWVIASEVKAQRHLIRFVPSNNGSKTEKRRIESSLRAGLPARSIGRDPCARIRRWLSTRGQEARTTLKTSSVRGRKPNGRAGYLLAITSFQYFLAHVS